MTKMYSIFILGNPKRIHASSLKKDSFSFVFAALTAFPLAKQKDFCGFFVVTIIN